MPYGQGSYGGRQQGQARIIIDENGNQQVVYDDVDVSPTAGHEYSPGRGFIAPKRTNIGTFVSLGALGAGGANSALGGGASFGSSGSGAAIGSVPGYTTAAAPAAFTPSLAGTGLASYGGSAASGLGLLGTAPAAAAVPAAFTPGLAGTGLGSYGGSQAAGLSALTAPGGGGFGAAAGTYGKMLAGQAGQAIPSLVASYFMGGDQRALARAQAQQARAQTVGLDQANMYREFMRPLVQQAMMGAFNRLPTYFKGNLPQNFPQYQGSVAPQPSGQRGADQRYLPRF